MGTPIRLVIAAVATVAMALVNASAHAWSNHTLATAQALEGLPELAGKKVKVETLQSFLAAEDKALVTVLVNEEAWARANVPNYPPRPDALAWQAGGPADTARARFVAALRINPGTPLSLFVQRAPGSAKEKRTMPWREVTMLDSLTTRAAPFVKLTAGESIAVKDVIATAADEPDYGMDIGLWADNGTPQGATYGFGPQPFGNAKLDYATQAPFHMGFYHETELTYRLASFLGRTYPEYRIHLYQTLARHALNNGHPYWGWRFAGWALHYIGDLTQPYHARVLPGVSLPEMVWINTLDNFGSPGAKSEAITLVGNRHTALEYYQYFRMHQALREKHPDDPLLVALRDNSRDGATRYQASDPRQVLTAESAGRADVVDATLETSFPERYTRDPSYEVGADKNVPDLYGVVKQSAPAAQQSMEQVTAELLGRFGVHTRRFVRELFAKP